jgi:hypothetical protein
MTEPQYKTVAEAADIAGKSRQAIHKLIQRGRIPSTMRFGVRVVKLQDLQRFKPKRASKSNGGKRK